MPFGSDPFQQIVNVQWGGGGFVAAYRWGGTSPNSKVYSSSNGTDWHVTLTTPSGWPETEIHGFAVTQWPGGAVYGKEPNKFVLVGQDSTYGITGRGAAYIVSSSDGKTWSAPQTEADLGEVYLVTWNEDNQAFYAGMHDLSQLLDPDSAREVFDVALKSTDGLSWTEVGRADWWGDPKDPRAPVEPYCSNKIRDKYGNKVPTSVFGYDKNKDILIAPDPLWISFANAYPADESEYHGQNGVKIIKEGGTPTIKMPTGMDSVAAVAFAGGIWQAAGSIGNKGVIATSHDDGETWTVTLTETPDNFFSAVAGGKVGSLNAGL